MAKKVEHRNEILESPEALAERLQGAETWVERHPKTVIGVAVAIALVVGGYFGFRYYIDNQNAEAQREMFQAVYYFEADSLNLALNGAELRTLEVLSVDGKLIQTLEAEQLSEKLSIDLETGMYFIRLTEESGAVQLRRITKL